MMAPHTPKKDNDQLKTIKFYGLLPTIEFQKVKCCADDLFKKFPDIFNSPIEFGMLEFYWSNWLIQKKKELKGESFAFSGVVMVFVDNQLVGDSSTFIRWAVENYNFEDFRNEILYETLRKEAYAAYLTNTENDFVYMDFFNDNEKLGKIVIELFKKEVPKTCENFKLLCTGEKGRSATTSQRLHFKNTIINRIVTNGWIQGGDVGAGKGNTSESVYGGFFEDESFAIKHNKRGIVGMANNGRHTNGSQFYITLQPAPWMDKKYVAFGQVVEGSQVLKRLEAISTQNERPTKELKIDECGIYTFEF